MLSALLASADKRGFVARYFSYDASVRNLR